MLSDKELQVRRKNHLKKLAAHLIDTTELSGGYIYRFPLDSLILKNLTEFIDLERKCCPFLSFTITVGAGEDFVSLDLAGPENLREVIKSLFTWN